MNNGVVILSWQELFCKTEKGWRHEQNIWRTPQCLRGAAHCGTIALSELEKRKNSSCHHNSLLNELLSLRTNAHRERSSNLEHVLLARINPLPRQSKHQRSSVSCRCQVGLIQT